MIRDTLGKVLAPIIFLVIVSSAHQLWAGSPEQNLAVPLTAEIDNNRPITAAGFSETRPQSMTPAARSVTVSNTMNEDFEGTWPSTGWQLSDNSNADGGDYLWGKRNCRPQAGAFSGWGVGGGANGQSLGCSDNYPNNALSWAIYGPFDLSGVSQAELTFHIYGSTAGADSCPWDFMFVGGSTDGNDFSGARYCGAWKNGSAGNGFHQRSFDLSGYVGDAHVWVAFVFASNGSVTADGFTIDDVKVTIDNSPTPSPTATQPPPTPSATPTPQTMSFIFLPVVEEEQTVVTPPVTITPSLTPVPPSADVPCLLVIAPQSFPTGSFSIQAYCVKGPKSQTSIRYDPRTGAISGFLHVIFSDAGDEIYRANINISRDAFGRIGSYAGTVSGNGLRTFDETIVNRYDPFGKIISAKVTKVYHDTSESYMMDLMPCVSGITWSGYKVTVNGGPYNGDEFTVGTCR